MRDDGTCYPPFWWVIHHSVLLYIRPLFHLDIRPFRHPYLPCVHQSVHLFYPYVFTYSSSHSLTHLPFHSFILHPVLQSSLHLSSQTHFHSTEYPLDFFHPSDFSLSFHTLTFTLIFFHLSILSWVLNLLQFWQLWDSRRQSLHTAPLHTIIVHSTHRFGWIPAVILKVVLEC